MACAADIVIRALSELAPEDTAEPYDHVGLQIGKRGKAVSRILLALEATGAVVREALAWGADMLVLHHPLFWSPCHAVDEDTPAGALAADLVRMGAVVYVMHTNLDKAAGGVNDRLMASLGVADPYIPAGQPLLRAGSLDGDMEVRQFMAHAARSLAAGRMCTAGPAPARIRLIAAGAGAAGDMLDTVAGIGADAFVTGELKYHQALEAAERGIFAVMAGHFETEWPAMVHLKKYLQKTLDDLKYRVEVKLSSADISPYEPAGVGE